MYDAALYYAPLAAAKSKLLAKLNLDEYFLATLHRSENTDDPVRLKSIVHSLNRLNKSVPVVLPLHPRTQKALHELGLHFEGVAIGPVGYFDMIELIRHCSLVLTDSGGLQKEAYFFQKHCVTLRDETEWTELVELGFNKLAGADEEKITLAAEEMKAKKSDFSRDLFGGGKACEVITKTLLDYRY
jgi:UDP-GlcNAc3NAcA epimerase